MCLEPLVGLGIEERINLGAGRERGRLWTRRACQLVSSFPRSGSQLWASDSFLFTSFLNFLPGKSEMSSKHVSGSNG